MVDATALRAIAWRLESGETGGPSAMMAVSHALGRGGTPGLSVAALSSGSYLDDVARLHERILPGWGTSHDNYREGAPVEFAVHPPGRRSGAHVASAPSLAAAWLAAICLAVADLEGRS